MAQRAATPCVRCEGPAVPAAELHGLERITRRNRIQGFTDSDHEEDRRAGRPRCARTSRRVHVGNLVIIGLVAPTFDTTRLYSRLGPPKLRSSPRSRFEGITRRNRIPGLHGCGRPAARRSRALRQETGRRNARAPSCFCVPFLVSMAGRFAAARRTAVPHRSGSSRSM